MSKRKADLEVSAGGIVFRRAPESSPRYLLIKDSYDNWGFPKGHLENGESPAEAALRETAEETGLGRLVLQGPIRVIDWHFRFRGRHIHKYCHFFLFESPEGDPCPQVDVGITACQWRTLEEALDVLSYDNALETVPTNVIASLFNFRPREYFQTEDATREAPRVQFTEPQTSPPPAPSG